MGRAPGQSVLPTENSDTNLMNWEKGLQETVQEGLSLREEIKQAVAEAEADRWEAIRLLNLYLPVLSLNANGYSRYAQGVFDGISGRNIRNQMG